MPKPVRITRQQVYDLIKSQTEPLSSKQTARKLGIKEVSVRAAISWLVLGGYLKENGHATCRTKPNKKGWQVKYKVKLYKTTNRVFDASQCQVHTKGIHCQADREAELARGKFNADLSFLDSVLFGRMKAKV